MMGRREGGQEQFFYAFDLDKVVPPDHLVRQIDSVIDLSWVHKELAPYYSDTGRPSIDPVLMIRMLIVGYVFAIRSERRICAEVQVNLAYRWFCKLGIEDRIPNHSVFCRARHERFRESDALRRVFEGVVATCIAAGLVGGEAFSIDASLIKADVDKKKRLSGDQPIAWPKSEEASHAVREYLAALDGARSEDEGDSNGSNSGARGGKPPKQVSLTDPQAAWVTRKGIDPFFAYDANYLIDNKVGIILDAEGTRANRKEESTHEHDGWYVEAESLGGLEVTRVDFDVAVSAETGGGGKGSIKVEKLRMPIESRSVCPFGCLMVQNRKINPSIGRFSTLISALRDLADSQARLVLALVRRVGRGRFRRARRWPRCRPHLQG